MSKENNEKNLKDKASKVINDVKDDSNSFNKKDIEEGKGMSILCYLGFLVLIPYFTEKNNKYVIYNAKQGLNLFIYEIIFGVAVLIFSFIFWRIWIITNIIEFIYDAIVFAFSILGIINVLNGKAKELPVINKFKFIK